MGISETQGTARETTPVGERTRWHPRKAVHARSSSQKSWLNTSTTTQSCLWSRLTTSAPTSSTRSVRLRADRPSSTVGRTPRCAASSASSKPTQTSFLQALNIPSKITKGTIEILNDVDLLHVGDKVDASQAALLAKLSIFPFSYGLVIRHVFEDGSLFS